MANVTPVSALTAQFLHALERVGLTVKDLRGKLPSHASKSFARRDPSKLKGLTGHHTAGPTGTYERFLAVAEYHVGPNHVSSTGAPGILYTLGIDKDGVVCIFHDLEVATWSQGTRSIPGDENADYLAVLVLGDFSSKDHQGSEPTLDQMHAFLGVAKACRWLWGLSFDFTGHFQFGKPACPGATLETIIRAAATHVVVVDPRSREPMTMLEVQVALDRLGFDPGPIDGLPGPSTRSAICAFQKSADLVVDGQAGPATIAALDRALES